MTKLLSKTVSNSPLGPKRPVRSPIGFLLTGGQVADCTAPDVLLEQMPPARLLHGDNGYDSDAVRRKIEGKGATPKHSAQSQPALEELLLAVSLP